MEFANAAYRMLTKFIVMATYIQQQNKINSFYYLHTLFMLKRLQNVKFSIFQHKDLLFIFNTITVFMF